MKADHPTTAQRSRNLEQAVRHPLEGEIVVYRSYRAEAPLVILFFISLAMLFFLSGTIPGTMQRVYLPVATGISYINLPLFGLVPLTLFFYLIHRVYNFRFIISLDHLRSLQGIISFRLRDMRIDFEHIRGIEIDRSLINRFMGIGDLRIGSSMHSDQDIVFSGILHPELYRDIIEARVRECLKTKAGHELGIND